MRAFPGSTSKEALLLSYGTAIRRERVVTPELGEKHYQLLRELDEYDIFVRDIRALEILRKVLAKLSRRWSRSKVEIVLFGWPRT